MSGGVADYNKSAKAMKNLNSVAGENLRKINQRSQSVLKSHTEFNHNFTSNHQSSASMGSSTTQRAHANHANNASV